MKNRMRAVEKNVEMRERKDRRNIMIKRVKREKGGKKSGEHYERNEDKKIF